MKRCTQCIIPEHAKGIKLNPDGLCQLCRDFKNVERKGELALKDEVSREIDRSGEFDCVVPVSGGRDSSYALYYVKEVLGLKPLAVHNDNDFETPIATENLDKITSNLNVRLVRTSSKTRISKKIVTEKFKMNAHFGAWRIVEQTCEACKFGFESASYNTAREMGIKLIIWGDSVEESTTPYHLLAKPISPTRWKRLFSPGALNLLRYKYYFRKMKKEYGPDSPQGLTEIHLYDYIEWDRNTIVHTIESELGWSKPDGAATSWRIDCSLVPLVNYLTEKAYGVSKIELGFSQMIRSGKMDREDALLQANEIKNLTNVDELKSFLKELGISRDVMNKVL